MVYSLFKHDCLSCHVRTKIQKFAADSTKIGLITNFDESEYRDQVNKLIGWCNDNSMELNVNKTKNIIVDFTKCHFVCNNYLKPSQCIGCHTSTKAWSIETQHLSKHYFMTTYELTYIDT